MKRKILSLFVSGCLLASLVGCGSESSSSEGSSTGGNKIESDATGNGIDFSEDPYTITVAYPVYGDAPADLPKIQDKVNEVTLKKINAKVEFKPVAVSNMPNTYTLAASSGEKLDLIMMIPGENFLTQYAGSNMIRPIDDLLDKYGKDIKAGLGDILNVAKVNGKQYGIPGKETDLNSGGVWLLDSILRKYNIDPTKIKTLDDFDPIFERVHAAEPDLQIFFPSGVANYLLNFDLAAPAVLRNGGTDVLKVVNMYETEEYVKLVKKMREWYQKGYISKDFATNQSSATQMMDADKLFCGMNPVGFRNDSMGQTVPKYQVSLNVPVIKTSMYSTFIWSVLSQSERPEKAVQFLNLVFQDQAVANLLKYGVEGEHYVTNTNGTIDISKGAAKFFMNWQIWGNTDKYPLRQESLMNFGGDIEKYKSAEAEWSKNSKTSKAYGFIFNSDPVKTEVAACTAVTDQYGKLIEGGAVDPDKYLKMMNEKLYAAGLQKVIDEKQRQLDEWAKTQK